MPKPTKGPRLGGSSSHQKAMLANLATSLFEHGRIKTTETKARALRPYAEKLITHAKKGTLHNRREVMKKIRDKDVVHTLFAEIGPFFADRNGGYTRIIKVEARKGDNAPMAVIELVREKTVTVGGQPGPSGGCVEEGRAREGGPGSRRPRSRRLPTRLRPRRTGRRGLGRGDEAIDEARRPRPRSRRPRSSREAPRPSRGSTPTRMPTSHRQHERRARSRRRIAVDERRTRHRFRWRVRSSSARYRLRRNRVRGLGAAGGAAHRGRRSRRRVVDGVPRAGAAACGGPHRRGCACDGSGGPRRRAYRCAVECVPAGTTRAERQRVPAAGATARSVLAGRCARPRHRPCRSGFRRPVLGAAAALRLPAVDRPVRC